MASVNSGSSAALQKALQGEDNGSSDGAQHDGSLSTAQSLGPGPSEFGCGTSILDLWDRPDVFTWGQNASSELILGDMADRDTPELVKQIRELDVCVQQVVAGNEHTALLTDQGQVYCCGYNDSGQCGIGNQDHVLQLRHVEALQNENIVQIFSANGCEHILALTQDGKLFSWGYNSRGQLGLGLSANECIPRTVSTLMGKVVRKVACSYHHTILSTIDDEVFGTGRNDHGQLGVGDNLDRAIPSRMIYVPTGTIQSIACGQYHTVVNVQKHGIYACGKNDMGQLGIPSLGSEPRLGPTPLSLPGAPKVDIVAVTCGYGHTVVLTQDGEVYAWGRNDHGQLGIGNTENKRFPQKLAGLKQKMTQVAAGCYHTLLLDNKGQAYAFGKNNLGQLGIGPMEDDVVLPTKVHGLDGRRVSSIAAGFYHSVCITESLGDVALTPTSSSLGRDLAPMVNNPIRSDVEFLVEDRVLYAHRCILMFRCEPLERMLNGTMREASEKSIVIPNIQYNVMVALLEYLYTDEVKAISDNSIDLEFALDLRAAADQFLVTPLKKICEAVIRDNITIGNVAEMLATADNSGVLDLRKFCLRFIQRNFSAVIGTEGFVQLPRDLLREVLQMESKRRLATN